MNRLNPNEDEAFFGSSADPDLKAMIQKKLDEGKTDVSIFNIEAQSLQELQVAIVKSIWELHKRLDKPLRNILSTVIRTDSFFDSVTEMGKQVGAPQFIHIELIARILNDLIRLEHDNNESNLTAHVYVINDKFGTTGPDCACLLCCSCWAWWMIKHLPPDAKEEEIFNCFQKAFDRAIEIGGKDESESD